MLAPAIRLMNNLKPPKLLAIVTVEKPKLLALVEYHVLVNNV
jgi:hypothetical protein